MESTTPTEAQTRKQLIDPALERAGWHLNNPDLIREEIPVDDSFRDASVPYDAPEPPAGITDYALYRENGEILAVVEAKRTSIDPRLAVPQAEFYATEIEKRQSFRPFRLYDQRPRDLLLGRGPRAQASGLRLLLPLRPGEPALPPPEPDAPHEAAINTDITDRPYQIEAIRRVCEAFESGKRKALLVMATGTGKTRVGHVPGRHLSADATRRGASSLSPTGTRWSSRPWTMASRPTSPTSPAPASTATTSTQTNRLYVVTLQTLNNCFREFTPGFFDLIIFDEVHRSIFNRWNEPLQYFDAPHDRPDRHAGRLYRPQHLLAFECPDEVAHLPLPLPAGHPRRLPGRLCALRRPDPVPAPGHPRRRPQRGGPQHADRAGPRPRRAGLRGTDLEQKVTNRDTLRSQWEEIMDVCYKDQSGHAAGQDHRLCPDPGARPAPGRRL